MKSVSTNVTSIVAGTQTLFYFFFSFFLKTSVSMQEQAQSVRKKNKDHLFSSSPTPTPFLWRSINSPRFLFFIMCAQRTLKRKRVCEQTTSIVVTYSE